MMNMMEGRWTTSATKVAQTGSLPYRGLLIRRRLKSNRMADYQSATQQTDSLRYNTDL
jgi:hypothetical protein